MRPTCCARPTWKAESVRRRLAGCAETLSGSKSARRSSRADMLGGFFGKDDPKSKKKGKKVVDNGLLPFDFPEVPELPFEVPDLKPKWLVTSWWTSTFAPVIDAMPFYVKGEGLAVGPLGNVPLWFIFGYLGPCADPAVPM